MDFLKTPEMRLHDDARIQEIIDEINSGQRDDVAWAKALKSAKGNTSYAQALYIDERIQRLADFQHIIAVDQKEKRLKELNELKKLGNSWSPFWFVIALFGFAALAILLRESELELGFALVISLLLGAVLYLFERNRLNKRRKEIMAELDKLSPLSKRSSWLGPLFVLVVVALTLGYFLA